MQLTKQAETKSLEMIWGYQQNNSSDARKDQTVSKPYKNCEIKINK